MSPSQRPVRLLLGLTLFWALPTHATQVPPTLVGAVIDLGRLHTGRYDRYPYSLSPQDGKLAVIFAPTPLPDRPETLRGAAVHLVRFAFGVDLSAVTPRTSSVDGVPHLHFTAAGRTFVLLPVRNARKLVHSVFVWALPEAPGWRRRRPAAPCWQ